MFLDSTDDLRGTREVVGAKAINASEHAHMLGKGVAIMIRAFPLWIVDDENDAEREYGIKVGTILRGTQQRIDGGCEVVEGDWEH